MIIQLIISDGKLTRAHSYYGAIADCCKWFPLFFLFFSGLSYHLSKAILCHFLGINMEWTTTAKELDGGFRVRWSIFRDFRNMYIVIVALIGMVLYLALGAPHGWRITDFSVLIPLAQQLGCHALLPFIFLFF